MRASAILVATSAISLALLALPARANESGRAGYSGKQNQTCNACHAGGTAPAVRFEGPTQVVSGATATFRFVVVSEAPSQDQAGFNVAASAGSLRTIAGQGSQLSSSELTHNDPKDVDRFDEATWELNWIAPAALGEQTLYGAGNAVNGNGNTTGDRSRATTFKVQVIAGPPTTTATPTTVIATPTGTVTHTATVMPSATRTATVMSTATVTSAAAQTETPTPTAAPPTKPACVGDCDADQRVTVAELVTGVNIALDRSPITTCRAIDRDADQRVTVAELVDAVSRALSGCAANQDGLLARLALM